MKRLKGMKKLARRVAGKEGLTAFAERCRTEIGVDIHSIDVVINPEDFWPDGQILARSGGIVLLGIPGWYPNLRERIPENLNVEDIEPEYYERLTLVIFRESE